MHIADVYPTPRDFQNAPIEDRGLALAVHLKSAYGAKRFAVSNFAGQISGGFNPPGTDDAFLRAYSEAFEWMKQNLLCAEDLSQHASTWFFLTDAGLNVTKETIDTLELKKILPKYLLHDRIRDVSLPIFMIGKFEAAVFEAFKEIEIATRAACKFEAQAHGQPMMTRAFHADKGPLRFDSEIDSERQALQQFMAGALGLFKNPRSHRNTDLNDPKEAAEMLMIASHMMRIIEAQAAPGLAK